MKIDTILLNIRDFQSLTEALVRASTIITTLLQTHYTAIMYINRDNVIIEYSTEGSSIPMYVSEKEFNKILQGRGEVDLGPEVELN